MDVLIKICKYLGYDFGEIMELLPDAREEV